MALIAHRMMLRSRSRPAPSTHQQLVSNKVGVLLVPSLADYYNDTNLGQHQPTKQQETSANPTQNQIELSLNVAGGASLASRQARQRQRQQKKTQQLQAKLHPPKAAGIVLAEHGASTPTRHSRQFHQLPNNYLRTPQAQARKLSASYTAQSKLLLPIDEGDTQSVLHMQMHSHAHGHYTGHPGHSHHAHSHAHQQGHQHMGSYTPDAQHTHHHQHGRVSPRLVHRHSGSSGTSFHYTHLPKSATATLPLVSQVEATPPTSPEGVAVAGDHLTGDTPPTMTGQEEASTTMALPCHDSIIVTPATPMASPGHVAKPRDELSEAAAEKQPLTAAIDSCDDDEHMQPPTGPLERKCSVYRMRRSDAFELDAAAASAVSGVKRQFKELQFNQQHQQYEPLLTDDPHIMFRGGRKVQLCAYCEEGICVCEHIEMQAALMLRSKSRVARRRKLRKLGGRLELPSNVATKEIAPFPRYPPES
ncbi:hypothetical protein FF38_07919, partial [Lucilia cuprina]